MHLLDRVDEVRQPFEREVLALHRDHHAVRGAQAVERQQRQCRRAVDQHEIVVAYDRRQRIASIDARDSPRRPVRLRRQPVRGSRAARRSRRLRDASAHPRSTRRPPALRRPCSSHAALSMPLPIVALPCGSRSMSRTRCPCAARLAARLTAVVVFPTPPFWFATQKIFAIVWCVPFCCLDKSECAVMLTRLPVAQCPASSSNFDQMALGIERRHLEPVICLRVRACRQALDLAIRPHTLHRPDRALAPRPDDGPV